MRVKYYLLSGMLLLSVVSYAQKTIETWYDENWTETHEQYGRYYSHRDNTDSGWYRKDMYVSTRKWQMVGLYADKECTQKNGLFLWFYPDGKLKTFGNYDHNKKKGIHLEFFPDGSIKDSAYYIDGNVQGISAGWYKNGNPQYTLTVDANGNGVYTSWFDNGQPSSAGRYKNYSQKNGRWQFFHKNGKVSAVELYDLDVMKGGQYFSEDGSPEDDTSKINQPSQFPGGNKAWSKFISNNIYFPPNLDIKNSYHAVLLVTATVNEEGKVTDVQVDLPLHPQMDKIAVDALNKSQLLIPAKEHNRKISSKITQTVSFERTYD